MTVTISADFLSSMIRFLRVNETETTREEVRGLILAAAADLSRQGAVEVRLDDALTAQAVKLYCKAHYGYDAGNDRFLKAYEALSASMALCGDYRAADTDGEGGDLDG